MSAGQRSRTPAQFPRMKHRAAGRLAKKRGGLQRWQTLTISATKLSEAMQHLAAAMRRLGGVRDE